MLHHFENNIEFPICQQTKKLSLLRFLQDALQIIQILIVILGRCFEKTRGIMLMIKPNFVVERLGNVSFWDIFGIRENRNI